MTKINKKIYDHLKIEKKWQAIWNKKEVNKTLEKGNKPKCYVLDMFPYPSGEGLHVGHPRGYIATDVYSRFKKMQGFNVLHPMGWDAFGLPAEQYAIKMKINPEIAVKKNVKRFKEQISKIGLDYDWKREINTTDPEYYRWTQWIFLQLFKNGLAYESFEPINWCPSCKTGLANEDVEDGKCERCGTKVEKKPMRQWVLKIRDYADRLVSDLDVKDVNGTEIFLLESGEPCFMQVIEPGTIRKDLPFVERKAIAVIVKHWSEDKYIGLKWKKVAWQTVITGGVEKGQTSEIAAAAEILEETGYKNIKSIKKIGRVHSKFFHVPKNENRFAHFEVFFVELKDGEKVEVSEKEKSIHEVVWIKNDGMADFISPEAQKYMWTMHIGKSKEYMDNAGFLLNWPVHIKESQRNWIGKSEGSELWFNIANSDEKITVFTTRPDTLYGVTYVVLAPEHKLIEKLKCQIKNWKEVEAYIKSTKSKSEIERTSETKDKTGVKLEGVIVKHPITKEIIPAYISDYVLAHYGTGAVMAVPAHDDRDYAFAKKYNLPVKQVIVSCAVDVKNPPREGLEEVKRDTVVVHLRDKSTGKFALLDWHGTLEGVTTAIMGGIESGQTPEEAALMEIEEEASLKKVKIIKQASFITAASYCASHKNQNRIAHVYSLLAEVDNLGNQGAISEKEQKNHTLVWVSKNEVLNRLTPAHQKQVWKMLGEETALIENGYLINSGQFDDMNNEDAKKAITDFAGGEIKTTYKLQNWVFSRQRYWGEPIPLIHCERCGVVPVPEKDLPLKLPKVKSYEPTGTGESPLAAISKWVNTKCPKCGGKAKRETNTMPQWAGSSWYYLRYMDPKNKKVLVDKKKEKYWAPVDMYVGGAEHATRHLIYARFWHKFLFDIGVVSTKEPFKQLRNLGMVLGLDNRKMSKRWGNVVNPDEVIKNVGADTLRVYESFMGPFEQEIAWSTDSMVGSRRFLDKVWKLQNKVVGKYSDSDETILLLNKTIKKVGEDIESFNANTAVSSMMIFCNHLEAQEKISEKTYLELIKILLPFAPHISEEIWHMFGNKKLLVLEKWPKYNEAKLVSSKAKIVVQINGRVRTTLEVLMDSAQADVEREALKNESVVKWIGNKKIIKTIFIRNKIINFVI